MDTPGTAVARMPALHAVQQACSSYNFVQLLLCTAVVITQPRIALLQWQLHSIGMALRRQSVAGAAACAIEGSLKEGLCHLHVGCASAFALGYL